MGLYNKIDSNTQNNYSNKHYIDGFKYKFLDTQKVYSDFNSGKLFELASTYNFYATDKNGDRIFNPYQCQDATKLFLYDALVKRNVAAQRILKEYFKFSNYKEADYIGCDYKTSLIKNRNRAIERSDIKYDAQHPELSHQIISKTTLQLYQFMQFIAATKHFGTPEYDEISGIPEIKVYDYTHSYKQIVEITKDKKVKPIGFYYQNQEYAEQTNKLHLGALLSTNFNMYANCYCTKNSFIGNRHCIDGLFSFDNIVIDIDKHKQPKDNPSEATQNALKDAPTPAGSITIPPNDKVPSCTSENLILDSHDFKAIQRSVHKLIKKLNKEVENGNFLEFNAVMTGRGVQLWVHLYSFAARTKVLQNMYTDFVTKLKEKINQVIADNHIDLEIDNTATDNMAGLYRLPYTKNMKVYKPSHKGGNIYYKTQWLHQTDRRYTLDELCNYFGFKRSTNPNQAIAPSTTTTKILTPQKQSQFNAVYVKRHIFLQQLAKNCEIGRRNNVFYFFYMYSYLLYPEEQAKQMAIQLNNSFSTPLRMNEIQTTMNWITNKIKANIPIYKITTKKFLNKINASDEECNQYNINSQRYEERQASKKRMQEKRDKIKELSEQGMTQKEIREQTGYCKGTVTKYANKLTNRKEKIIELYNKGLTTKQIAEQCNCSTTTVTRNIKDIKQTKEEKMKQIQELSNQGLTHQQIADKLKISKSTVKNYLKQKPI